MNLRRVSAPVFVMLSAQPALAQTLGQGADTDISVWRIVASLILCGLLAVGGAFVLKARGGSFPAFSWPAGKSRRLRLVESLKLAPNAAISIVECDGRELLVSVSAEGSRVLEELPARRDIAVEHA